MVELPEIGKISREVFEYLIYPHLGAKSKSILVGPQHGVDVGIVEIGGKAVAMTADPVFIVPEYGFKRSAWFAIHILASDVVTSGLPPTYLSIDLNLPLSMKKEELEIVWKTIDEECKKMGMAIVCGHTARYDNCNFPMVGGATVLAVGDIDSYVSPKFIKEGDLLIITKGPAIEASGIFLTMFPDYIKEKLGEKISNKGEEIFYKMSVVEDAMEAVKAGVRDEGVSAMHDATECGIYGGVFEMALAANLGIILEKDNIVIEEGIPEICDLFKIDPFSSISEGTLLIAVREKKADKVLNYLKEKNIKASVAGEFISKDKGFILKEGGREKKLSHPEVDPFWNAFYTSLKELK